MWAHYTVLYLLQMFGIPFIPPLQEQSSGSVMKGQGVSSKAQYNTNLQMYTTFIQEFKHLHSLLPHAHTCVLDSRSFSLSEHQQSNNDL